MRSGRKAFQILLVLETVILIAVLVYGILQMGKAARPVQEAGEHAGEQLFFDGENEENQDLPENTNNSSAVEGEFTEFSPEVDEKLAALTLEEKAAQMLLTTPEALTHNETVNIARSGTRDAINACPVGGLVYGARNFQGKEQTQALLEGVQGYSLERIGLPLFLAVEEIGGNDHSPLAVENSYALQASPAVLGAGGKPEKAAEAGTAIATYMKAEGFNLNLMPAAGLSKDLAEDQKSRCFGEDTALAAMMLTESVGAFRAGGILTAVGHFPWKGNDKSCPKRIEEWQNSDVLMIQAAVNAGTDMILLGNAAYGELTGEGDIPCSLSANAIGWLRKELAYTGIILTDDLTEESVALQYSVGEAAVAAAKAGADLLYCPTGVEEAYQSLLQAVRDGEIPKKRIEEAVGRILTKKLAMMSEE